MKLDQLRFVVDENTLAVGTVKQQLRDDVAYVGDPLISSLIPRRSLDKHWIPIAAEHGWVAITNDHHMRTRHYEASLALEHGLMVINIKGNSRGRTGRTGHAAVPHASEPRRFSVRRAVPPLSATHRLGQIHRLTVTESNV